MGMISCRECQKEISSEAKSCVNCGAPIKPRTDFKKVAKKTTRVAIGFIAGLLILAVILYWGLIDSPF